MLIPNWPGSALIAAVILKRGRFGRQQSSINTHRPPIDSLANYRVSDSDYSLYILRCADASLYTGIAIDVDKRLQEHVNGAKGSKYLRGRAPFSLVFQEVTGDRSLASRLEHRVKRLDRRRKEALINGELSLLSLLQSPGVEPTQASGGSCG